MKKHIVTAVAAALATFGWPAFSEAGVTTLGSSYTVYSTSAGEEAKEYPSFTGSLVEALVEGKADEDIAVTVRRTRRKMVNGTTPVVDDQLRGTLSLKAAAAAKIALIVGVSDYGARSLSSPTKDARLLDGILKGLGFTTTLVIDPDLAEFNAAVQSFTSAGTAPDTALVYFSGNGFQSDGQNYIVPSMEVGDGTTLQANSIAFKSLRDTIEGAFPQSVLIIDAGRSDLMAKQVR
ncbi:caspase family protein [Pararhizobium sp.]|uniref:caspase family protein n=1 Tax=Pararhizobium sp. TaxID=1977563 RepID=UPI0027181FA4|nr:caspase family protein [Pararhizobium sp.]MDO9417780.1 caspase family protein [Pararhizobium sp.]